MLERNKHLKVNLIAVTFFLICIPMIPLCILNYFGRDLSILYIISHAATGLSIVYAISVLIVEHVFKKILVGLFGGKLIRNPGSEIMFLFFWFILLFSLLFWIVSIFETELITANSASILIIFTSIFYQNLRIIICNDFVTSGYGIFYFEDIEHYTLRERPNGNASISLKLKSQKTVLVTNDAICIKELSVLLNEHNVTYIKKEEIKEKRQRKSSE